MKVTGFDTKVVRNVEPFVGGRWWLFIELHTDEGITGLGERITGGAYSNSLDDMQTQIHLIKEMVEQYVIGQDPFDGERISTRLPSPKSVRNAGHQRNRHGVVGHPRQGDQPAGL